ncbi:hypothetical protein KCU71_g14620, partial [Aureobasidium melanogenum]
MGNIISLFRNDENWTRLYELHEIHSETQSKLIMAMENHHIAHNHQIERLAELIRSREPASSSLVTEEHRSEGPSGEEEVIEQEVTMENAVEENAINSGPAHPSVHSTSEDSSPKNSHELTAKSGTRSSTRRASSKKSMSTTSQPSIEAPRGDKRPAEEPPNNPRRSKRQKRPSAKAIESKSSA